MFFPGAYCHLMNDNLLSAAMVHSSRTHPNHQIGILCALSTEKAAVVAMLDETYPRLKKMAIITNVPRASSLCYYRLPLSRVNGGLVGEYGR